MRYIDDIVDEAGGLPRGWGEYLTALGVSEGPYLEAEARSPYFESAAEVLACADLHYLLTVDSYLAYYKPNQEPIAKAVGGLPLTGAFQTHRSWQSVDEHLVTSLLNTCEALLYTAYDGFELRIAAKPEWIGPLLSMYYLLATENVSEGRIQV